MLQLSFLFLKCMKNAIFWDVTFYSLVGVYQRFGGIYCLHLQGRRIRESEAEGKQS
jgi:hypothetical protein